MGLSLFVGDSLFSCIKKLDVAVQRKLKVCIFATTKQRKDAGVVDRAALEMR